MRILVLILTVSLALFWVKPAYAAIKINEFSSAGNPEWVELYNTGTEEVNLNGWMVLFHDNPTTSQKIILGSNDKILSGSFKIVERDYTNTVAWLNDSGDAIILKDSNGDEQDSVRYGNATGSNVAAPSSGQSAGRSPDATGGWIIFSSPTKGASNNTSSASPSPSPSPTSNPSSTYSTSTSFSISNVPSQIDSTEEFKVNINLSPPSSPNTTFYLKGAFKKADSSNYFGLTKVNGSWIKNNKTFSDQYKITTDGSGNWSGNLEIMPDILDSGYEGAGDYIFKVARYTESGSLTWSNDVSIKINAQEVVIEEGQDENILGAKSNTANKSRTNTSKKDDYSLEKYIKVASPASIAAAPIPQAEVKGERKTNYLSWIGGFMVISGIGVFAYVYLRNKQLREAIYNLLRRRN